MRELNSKVRRGDTKKSGFYARAPKSAGGRKSIGSSKSSRTSRSRSRSVNQRARSGSSAAGSRSSKRTSATDTETCSRGVSFESMAKMRPMVKTEVRHFKGVALEVDWRFYATGVCLAVVNLALAWDSTAISIALPVCATFVVWEGRKVTDRNRRWRWRGMGPRSIRFGWGSRSYSQPRRSSRCSPSSLRSSAGKLCC